MDRSAWRDLKAVDTEGSGTAEGRFGENFQKLGFRRLELEGSGLTPRFGKGFHNLAVETDGKAVPASGVFHVELIEDGRRGLDFEDQAGFPLFTVKDKAAAGSGGIPWGPDEAETGSGG